MFLLHPVKINILYKEGKIAELWIKIEFHFTYKITLRFGVWCLLYLKDFIWTEIQMKLEICTYPAVKKKTINWFNLQHGKLSGKKKKQTRKEKGGSEWSVRSYLTCMDIISVWVWNPSCNSTKILLVFKQDFEMPTPHCMYTASICERPEPNISIV